MSNDDCTMRANSINNLFLAQRIPMAELHLRSANLHQSKVSLTKTFVLLHTHGILFKPTT